MKPVFEAISCSGVTFSTFARVSRSMKASAVTRTPRPEMNDWKFTFLSPDMFASMMKFSNTMSSK